MERQQWQYAMMTYPVSLGTIVEEVDPAKIAERVARLSTVCMEQLTRVVENPLPGDSDLEAVSHDFVRIGQTLLLTILIRYRKS